MLKSINLDKIGESEVNLVELDGFIIDSIGVSVAETDKSVDNVLLGAVVAATDHEESSNHVEISHQTIVPGLGLADRRIDNCRVSQIVPEFFHSKFAEIFALRDQKLVCLQCTSLLGQAVSIDFDVSAVSDLDDVLVRTKSISHFEGDQVHGLVVGAVLISVSIAQPHEGVDFERRGSLGPGGDGQEGAHDVSVDGQELVGVISSVDCCQVKEASFGEIVPILFLDRIVHKVVDVVRSPVCLSRQGLN